MSNVFEEFQESETKEGVPIETFCAIAFGKLNSKHTEIEMKKFEKQNYKTMQ